MDIGWTAMQLQAGNRCSRKGWNGAYIELQLPGPASKMTEPFVFIRTSNDECVPWVCSQTDLLAEDWENALE